MSFNITELDVQNIRKLLSKDKNITIEKIKQEIHISQNQILSLINQNKALFQDESISNKDITDFLNKNIIPKFSPILSAEDFSLKSIASKPELNILGPVKSSLIPTVNNLPLPIPLENNHSSLPYLPLLDAPLITHFQTEFKHPLELGILGVVLHPSLGPAHACRILATCQKDSINYYLLSFFQTDLKPLYAPFKYVFPLEDHKNLFTDEGKFAILGKNVSVDFLLEQIYSTAQKIVLESSFSLFSLKHNAKMQPSIQQVQYSLQQSITYAAYLVFLYIVGFSSIPQDKIQKIIDTMFKLHPPKFISTQNIVSAFEVKIKSLLNIPITLPRAFQ